MSSPEIEVGAVQSGDIDTVLAIERACFANPWPRSAFELALRAREVLFLGARRDGVVCGYVVAAQTGNEVLVADLATAPGSRRLGVGTALLEAAIDWASATGAHRCRLEVRESNAPARALYGRHGFAEVGKVRGYYVHPDEDALTMALRLPWLSPRDDGANAAPDRRGEGPPASA